MEEEKPAKEEEKKEEEEFWDDAENPWEEAEGPEPEEDEPAEPQESEQEEVPEDMAKLVEKDEEEPAEEPEEAPSPVTPGKPPEIPKPKEEKKEVKVSKALEAEKKLKSSWYIIDLHGKMHKLELKDGNVRGFNFSQYPNLKKFALYEMAKSREVKEQPVHVNLMRKLQLADYEPASDSGNFRYYPNGTLIRELIIDLVDSYVFQYDAMKVETPVMYDMEHPTIKKYLDRFPARQYLVESTKKSFFLRFASCFGQFLIAKDAIISYRNLPMKIYELAKYSFRLEQRGELAGLRRLRGFVMPDCHCLCKDIPQAKEEMMTRFELAKALQKDVGFNLPDEFELGIRVVRSFYEEDKEFVQKMVKSYGKPALLEVWDKQFAYFIYKYEFNYVDSTDKAAALTTDQIDIENAKNYNILYTDVDNKRKHPIILHQSPSGGICRVLMALLERTRDMKNPMLPVWLAPEQVRILPVSDKYLKFADSLAKKLESRCIRVGIDDRQTSVSKKVFESKSDWIPYIIVVGEKEEKSKKLPVVIREKSREKDVIEKMTEEQLFKLLAEKNEGKPFRPMYMPRLLSMRPIFLAWSIAKEEEEKKGKPKPEKAKAEKEKPKEEVKPSEQKPEVPKKPAKKKVKKKQKKKQSKPEEKPAKKRKKKPKLGGESRASSSVALHKLHI